MLKPVDALLLEDELSPEDDTEILTVPEIRARVLRTRRFHDEEGIRSLLDQPQVLTRAWQRSFGPRSKRRPRHTRSVSHAKRFSSAA